MAASEQAVLVVDDDAGFRQMVRAALERAGFAVAEAADADAGLAAAADEPPALALVDVVLHGASGFELYRVLRDRLGEELPIIFVSGERTDPHDRVAGLLLGADDYLVKPIDPDELAARVRRSLRRWPTASEPAEIELTMLTAREREVLALLAEAKSSDEIAQELTISARTVGKHVEHILGKLGMHNRAQAVALAHRKGMLGRSGRDRVPT
jgi:two-component system nitrate/nitrite response regulator NarL